MRVIIMFFCLVGFLFAVPFARDLISFRIDKNHSTIGFSVPIQKGLSRVSGKFSDFKVDLDYDGKDITKSKVNVVIQAKSIDTGIDQRDAHLRTADFFDVEKFPEITFQSKKVIKNGDKLILLGDFTMRGVTKEISFPFKVLGNDLKDKSKLKNLGFAAKLRLNRREFGVNYQHRTLPNFIGDNIEVEINLLTRGRRPKN